MVAVRPHRPSDVPPPARLRALRHASARVRSSDRATHLDARLLTTPADLSEFDARYQDLTGFSPGVEYVRRADAIRALSFDGELRAGYVLNTAPPFRYLDVIPARAKAMVGAAIDLEDTVEVTALWMDPGLPPDERRLLYSWLFCDVLTAGRTFVLGGAVSEIVARQQMRSLPFLVYNGPTVSNGEPLPDAWVYWGTIHTAWQHLASGGYLLPWPAFRP